MFLYSRFLPPIFSRCVVPHISVISLFKKRSRISFLTIDYFHQSRQDWTCIVAVPALGTCSSASSVGRSVVVVVYMSSSSSYCMIPCGRGRLVLIFFGVTLLLFLEHHIVFHFEGTILIESCGGLCIEQNRRDHLIRKTCSSSKTGSRGGGDRTLTTVRIIWCGSTAHRVWRSSTRRRRRRRHEYSESCRCIEHCINGLHY